MSVRDKAEKLFQSVSAFLLTCVDEDGYPMTKAVVPAKYRDDLNEIYFCTNTASRFAGAVAKNPKACVYFYSQKLQWKGCMLRGDMEIVTDMAVKKKYWIDQFKDAYPEKAYTDPDFCVLRFVPVSGRYYAAYHPEDFEI